MELRRRGWVWLKVGVWVLVALAAWWYSQRAAPPPPVRSVPLVAATPAPEPLLAEQTLQHYGDPARPPEEDLLWMARTLDNFALLVKGPNPLPLGSNEELAGALRGRNRARLRAIPEQHPALDATGRLVDRWGTPLFFHAETGDRLDIRSAGPDRQMWTADDLHRRAGGAMVEGAELPELPTTRR